MLQQGFILVLSCLGIVQALFLCFYLFSLKKGNKLANRLLALILLALTIRIGKSIFHNYIEVDPRIRNLAISSILAVGPLLLLYGKVLLQKQKRFTLKTYAHFIPFILFFLLSPVIPNKRGDFLSSAIYLSVFVHLGIYLCGIYYYLIKKYSSSHVQLVTWYRNITLGVTVIWSLFVGIFFRWIPFYILGAISFSFLIYLFSYLLLKKHTFSLEKYGNSNMNKATSVKVLNQIKTLFEKEEYFMQEDISLASLAEKLQIAPRELSQVINENENKNFSEFVNYYRIKKAKTLLIDPKYMEEKIATIAYDSGFGNVTSFNLAFKAITNITPSQYRRQAISK